MFVRDKLSDSPLQRVWKKAKPPNPLRSPFTNVTVSLAHSPVCKHAFLALGGNLKNGTFSNLLFHFFSNFSTCLARNLSITLIIVDYLLFPGTEKRFIALKHSVAILWHKLTAAESQKHRYLFLFHVYYIFLELWNQFDFFLLLLSFLFQVQSTSWMPHQQYVMQPTVSALLLLHRVNAPGRLISRQLCLHVLLSVLCSAEHAEREIPISKYISIYSMHSPKNNLAVRPSSLN